MVQAVQGAKVVVTGAGGGIGAALARRFAAQGARVVVNDLDVGRAKAVAEEIGGLAVAGDASSIVGEARDALGGTVDVWCANAGVGRDGGEPGEPLREEDWALSWDVNVMAHVRAAHALLPEWLERGSGRFVSTVSAAGLLTMIGTAPYSVTKHGAYAFAEWLSLTYRHRGVRVHAICPQGVRTDMLDARVEVRHRHACLVEDHLGVAAVVVVLVAEHPHGPLHGDARGVPRDQDHGLLAADVRPVRVGLAHHDEDRAVRVHGPRRCTTCAR
ncbi:3-phenylpropionate-dihydrodiol/cinnamic acid-dihydrodiol dehydrogenase [Streptomyces griseoloalbus]